jgi:hypothetical protein
MAIRYLGRTRIARSFFLASVSSLMPQEPGLLPQWRKEEKDSEVRAKIAYQLNHEMGVPLAEIARHAGVCTSAVAKAIENMDSRNAK